MVNYQSTCGKTPEHKFTIGDKVVFTNEYGVCFGVKTIAAYAKHSYDDIPRYHYEGTDTPWYATEQKYFTLATEEDLLHAGDQQYFQDNYGFPTTLEQLQALLECEYDV